MSLGAAGCRYTQYSDIVYCNHCLRKESEDVNYIIHNDISNDIYYCTKFHITLETNHKLKEPWRARICCDSAHFS